MQKIPLTYLVTPDGLLEPAKLPLPVPAAGAMLSHNNMRKLFLLLFVLLALPAFAVQREVGSGQTYPTIGACITAASAGDICNVHAGTYNTAIIINKSITVQANPGDSPVINITGLGGIAVYISANGVIFDGFEVLGYGSVAVGSSGVYVNSGVVGAQIKNCKVHDGYGNGIRGNGANGPFLIDNCEIYGALQHAGVGLSGDGIDIISGTSSDGTFANGNTISNTLVHDSQIDASKSTVSILQSEIVTFTTTSASSVRTRTESNF